jgi:hypothetical protein
MPNTDLLIGGNLMHPLDGDAFWRLGDKETVRAAWNEVTTSQVIAASRIVCYSYGCANLWDRWRQLVQHGAKPLHKLLVIVAGVPDSWLGQFGVGIWHAPDFIQQAVCFNIDVIPVLSPQSYPLRNAGATRYSLLPGNLNMMLPLYTKYANIDCNSLVAGFDEVSKHTHIKDAPEVIAAINNLLV